MAPEPVGSTGAIVDLFCGCGGFTLGAELAGFHSLAAIDIEPTLQSGYRRNFPTTRAIQGDVSDFAQSDWRIVLNGRRPDGVIGGPPCQGFSAIGKKRVGDPRNSLIFEFFRQVEILRPRFFLMENVEGLLRQQNRSLLSDAISTLPSRYRVLEPLILPATEYGAATSRRRVAIIGFDPADFPVLTAEDFTAHTRRPATVREAIDDLPGPIPQNADKSDLGWADYPRVERSLSEYARAARSEPPAHLGSPEARIYWSRKQVSGLYETKHSEQIVDRYRAVLANKSDPITKSFKLDWDGHCPTLRAGTGSERGGFQAVRPLHPEQGRVITVREAARLQGFPDWFQFHPTKWQSFRMIGNSVSPYVSFALLSAVATKLRVRAAA